MTDAAISSARMKSSTNTRNAFGRVAWSNFAAQSAEQIGLAAAPIVAVIALGAGAGETGLLEAAQTLPFLLLAIPAGVLADRASRATLMAGAEALRVASLGAIMGLAAVGLLDLPLLALLGFIGAAGTVAYSVATPSLVPSLVPPARLAAANARIELARTVAFAGGPALAGALIGSIGATPAFAVAAALSTSAALLLGGIREPARPATLRRHPLRELGEGVRFVFGHPLLRPVFVTQAVFTAALFILQAAYVPFAVHQLGLPALGVGATLACYGVGMAVGALCAARVMKTLPFGTVIAIGPIAGLAASLALVATMWIPSGLVAGGAFFVMGAGPILWVISTTTLRQTVTPPDMLGRASAINILAYGARPLGAGIGAVLCGLYGPGTCLVAAAIGFAAQALVIMVSPVPRARWVVAAAVRE